MRQLRRCTLILSLAVGLPATAAMAQERSAAPVPRAADSARIARVAGMVRLWGEIEFFHPYLAYRPIDWDSAFAAAYPRVCAARDGESYAAAIGGMLDALHDSETKVLGRDSATPPMEKSAASPGPPLMRRLPDSTLVIRFSSLGDRTDYQAVLGRLDSVGRVIDSVSRVVLDLRGTRVATDADDAMDVATFAEVGWFGPPFSGHLITAPKVAPAQRARMWSGLPPQVGGSSGGYYAAFYTVDGSMIAPSPAARRHALAAIVDPWSSVPNVVLALAATGGIAIIAQGHVPAGAGASTHQVDLADGVRVAVRTSEPADGAGAMHADTTLDRAAPDSAVLAAVLTALRSAVTATPTANGTPMGAPAAVVPATRFYDKPAYPDSAHRVLAAARFWTAIEYLYPYRHLIGEDWSAVLPAAIASLEAARDSVGYTDAVVEMVRRIHDSHGYVGSPTLNDEIGEGAVPVEVRVIQDRLIVTALLDSTAAHAGFRVGDEITQVDGVHAQSRFRGAHHDGASSTAVDEQAQRAGLFLRGPVGSTVVIVVRGGDGRSRTVSYVRVEVSRAWDPAIARGPVMRLLPGNIGYADLARLTVPQVDTMFTRFAHTRAIIFDMRGYPNGTAWAIAPRLADAQGKTAATFRRVLRLSPDTSQRATLEFTQSIPVTTLPRYTGRTVMLIDDRTISQAEHTGLFFEAANGTKFIGTPSAGANGDVTNVVLPGGIVVYFSGHDVRHADGRQLQRIGLHPDLVMQPTVAGVRAGRDEVLEAAEKYVKAMGKPERN